MITEKSTSHVSISLNGINPSTVLKYPEVHNHFRNLYDIPVEQWMAAESLFVSKRFTKKTKILNFNDKADKFYVILSGIVRMYYSNSNGQEFTKSFMMKGDIASPFSEMLQGIPSRVCIEALSETEALELTQDQFNTLRKGHQCWKEVYGRLTEKYFIYREQREYDLLVLNTKERYEKFLKQYPDLFKIIPQNMVASYLAVTPVSLSRVLNSK